jgi:hypothetical protein
MFCVSNWFNFLRFEILQTILFLKFRNFQISCLRQVRSEPQGNLLNLLEHVFKKMCSIEIVPLSVRPSVCSLYFPHFCNFLPEFLIRGLEVLGLGP